MPEECLHVDPCVSCWQVGSVQREPTKSNLELQGCARYNFFENQQTRFLSALHPVIDEPPTCGTVELGVFLPKDVATYVLRVYLACCASSKEPTLEGIVQFGGEGERVTDALRQP